MTIKIRANIVRLQDTYAELGTIMEYVKLSPLHDPTIDKPLNSLVLNKNTYITSSNDYWKAQNLYFTTYDEIEVGKIDFWVIANTHDGLIVNELTHCIKCVNDPLNGKVLLVSGGYIYASEAKLIVATTNPKLREFYQVNHEVDSNSKHIGLECGHRPLLKPNIEFIRQYVKCNGQLSEVVIEIEGRIIVNIIPNKTHWTRDEVKQMLIDLNEDINSSAATDLCGFNKVMLDKWINTKLV